ncbi:MAG: T9SS type A sorting domain-containing protein [Candidatus Eisenbacteria bacterium]|uniref:T9SS type A sorting domain-containing protein n=1 Tax=Eiseniibacteriota bacterium TaxID=2212470 RepID=A0A948RXX0_UNCEI|nr:T9SS type A sorting domain-containing protein [Candidatus Eisenbacteria bacterium]MBU1949729.1 T9SS type A sorting domain-containing protein [Candidatus Eisenbacteria bacterium]MBU2693065.1 T9SS type A sorting domain-containing protein [Candidatus Eisenbacteria bacterium]
MYRFKLAVLFLVVLSFASTAQAADPAAYYDLEGNANDSSGNENHGIIHGNLIFTGNMCGQHNAAAEFNGTDSYIQVYDDPALHFQEITLSAYVYLHSLEDPSGFDTFINKIFGDPHEISYQIGVSTSTGKFNFGLNLGNTGYPQGIVESNTIAQLDTWYHVAGTYDGTEIIIYIDGVPENSLPYSQPIPYDDRDLELGVHAGYAHLLDGILDEARIYDQALSETEILDLIITCSPNLLACYSFDGDVTDCSGNENHGTGYGGLVYVADCEGEPTSALEFNGYDSYILVPDDDILHTQAMTLSAVVYLYNLEDTSGFDTFINKLYGSPHEISYELGVSTATNRFTFGLNLGSTGYEQGIVESFTEAKTETWYHVVGTYDGSELRIYVNGMLENSVLYSSPIPYDDGDLELGVHAGYTHLVDGIMDDIRIYDQPLSDQEIVELVPECIPELVACYGMNGDVNDCSIYQNHGEIYGDLIFGDDCGGQVMMAADFNGLDSHIQILDHPILHTQELTLVAAVYLRSLEDASSFDTFINKLFGSPHEISYELGVSTDTGKFTFGLNLGSTGYEQGIVESETVAELNTWYHIVGTYDGFEMRIYVNGWLENAIPYSNPIPYDDGNLEIGVHGGYAHLIDGLMDDVRIYDKALSHHLILNMMSQNPCWIDMIADVSEEENGLVTDSPGLTLWPSPTSGPATISFALNKVSEIELSIYDIVGRKVRDLVNGELPAGSHNVSWDGRAHDGRRLSQGIYFVRMRSDQPIATSKIVLR